MQNFPFAQSEALNIVILLCIYHCVIVCHGQHYVNLALGKPCRQSSTYGNSEGYNASKAVDNDIQTIAHTNGGSNEWLEVDLGRSYYVKDILIYFRDGFAMRVSSTTITVGGTVCASIAETTMTTNTTIFVTCQNMIYGQTVRITKNRNAKDRYINIAEFEVYGCQQGYYGDICNQQCRTSNCLNNECDRTTGQCTTCKVNYKPPQCTGCDSGQFGENCSQKCGKCLNDVPCNISTGHCKECKPGLQPPLCQKACTNGTFGSDCVKVCHCKDGQPCNFITGECSDGCTPGWTSKTCDQNCETGKYGQDCLQECGHCAGNAVCKVTTGHCRSCTPGLQPTLCKDDCKNGTYGGDCSNTCGHCKDGQPCNVITGECIDGCTKGWTGKTCDQSLVSFDIVIIAGAIIGGFLILAVSISVTIWLKRSKHRSVEKSNRKQVPLQTSFNRRHLQAQADFPNSLETEKEYDDTGNPYDSLDISVLEEDAKYTQPAFTKISTSTEKDTAN